MKVLVAGHEDVSRLLPMTECIEVMAEALATLARGEAVLPLRQVVRQPDGRGVLGMMPSYLGTPRAIGAKIVSVFPGNHGTPYDSHQGSVLLFECEHGRLLALVDAGAITAIRTAAVSAVATRLLAREATSTLAILGSGTQARMHLAAMAAVRPIAGVRIWSRDADHARHLVEHVADGFGAPIAVAATAEEAVRDADIVCTTTAARAPVLHGAWLAPGTHINAIGSSIPGYRELDTEAVAQSRLFVDRRESAINEADDFRLPKQEGRIGDDHIVGEIGEVLLGQVTGRTNAHEITVFKSLGLAIEDLAAAHYVYTKALERDAGTWVEFSGERH